MNKSNQAQRSPRSRRRLFEAIGIVLTMALMVAPFMAQADNSSSNSDADTAAQSQQSTQLNNGSSNPQLSNGQASGPAVGNLKTDKSTPDTSSAGQPAPDASTATAPKQNAQGAQGTQGDQGDASSQGNADGAKQNDDSQNKADTQSADPSAKPALAAILADNSRVSPSYVKGKSDKYYQLRMDLVLQVKHGAVDPNKVPLATADGKAGRDGEGACGLQLFHSTGDKGDQYKRFSYMNTLGSGSDSSTAKQVAATEWAKNTASFFTIHSVKTSDDGKFDLLSISIQGDVTYPDNPAGSSQLGGLKYDRRLYAVVGSGKIDVDGIGSTCKSADGTCVVPAGKAKTIFAESDTMTNIAAGHPVQLYSDANCAGSGTCPGPAAYTGQGNTEGLWSNGHANWGMHADNGFVDPKDSNKVMTNQGVAPANSFFATWQNAQYDANNSSNCGKTTAFYYQWFGLKDGNWLPVTALTDKALASDGQAASAPVSATNGGQQIPVSDSISYNGKKNKASGQTIRGKDLTSKNKSAQADDGSIDFAAAKQQQGLDGYFKLVAWPTTTDASGNLDGCVSTDPEGPNKVSKHDVYNPLYGGYESGVSEDMAQKHQDQAQYLMNLGWTVDTAFDGYDYHKLADVTPMAPGKISVQDNSDDVVPADDPAHTPELVKMLSYNDKVQVGGDEMRADFIMKVAHGDVNPNCVATGAVDRDNKCGLKVHYPYGGERGDTADYGVHYMNTLDGPNAASNNDRARAYGAEQWAKDIGAGGFYFTIRDVQTSGLCDYLTISLEGDANYYHGYSKKAGGTEEALTITAQVKNKATGRWGPEVNLTPDYKIHLYSDNGSGSLTSSAQADGPVAFVGYDETHPKLWSVGEANWGLIVDNGFWTQNTAKEVAPPNSFILRWLNRDLGSARNGVCSKVDKYYYQWFGLVNGRYWMPVDSLTPKAEKGSEGAIDTNTPTDIMVNTKGDNKSRNSVGGLMPKQADSRVQNADGSVDFAKVRELNPAFDGYFKMVTWPISTDSNGNMNSCSTGYLKDIYNPLTGHEDGITDDLVEDDFQMSQDLIDKGWTINTVYDRFSYKTAFEKSSATIDSADKPHTVKQTGELPANSTVKLKGTANKLNIGVPMNVDLYMAFNGDGQASSPEAIAANPANKIGSVPVTKLNSNEWSLNVPVGRFSGDPAKGDTYRIVAVPHNGEDGDLAYKDLEVDLTPDVIGKASKVSYREVSGKLDSQDTHKDFANTKVIVTWANGKSTVGTVDAEKGIWSVDPGKLATGGEFKVDVTDQAQNESLTLTGQMPKPIRHLPLTGSQLIWLVLAAVLILTADIAYRKYRSCAKDKLAVARRAAKGPRHKSR